MAAVMGGCGNHSGGFEPPAPPRPGTVLSGAWILPSAVLLPGIAKSGRLVRHAAAAGLALIVTMALMAVMVALIAEEFTPQDVVELGAFEINAQPEDIPLIAERKPPELRAPVETPPPPPALDVPAPTLPGEPIVSTAQPVLRIDASIMVPRTLDPVLQDGDTSPLVRIPPVMPPRATRSGHCMVAFDIGPDGRPFNVRATSCSQSLFERSAVRSIERWTYRPQISEGLAVTRTGLSTRISFQLTDEGGRIIPE
ncbi:MAG: energy transducer TonB [Pseudomonadota bacterium]